MRDIKLKKKNKRKNWKSSWKQWGAYFSNHFDYFNWFTHSVYNIIFNFSSETKGLQDHKDKEQSKLIELTKVKDAAKKEFQLAESELKRYVSSEENEKQKLDDLKKSLDNATINTQERKTYKSLILHNNYIFSVIFWIYN